MSGPPGGAPPKILKTGLHGGALSAACLAEAADRRLDVIRPIGGRTAVEQETAAGQAGSSPRPNAQPGFETFWEHHYRHYLMVLMAIDATLEDAHDTINDVIVDMLRKNTWDRLTANPKAWVRKAVVHTYYDRQKRQRLRRETEKHLTSESHIDEGLNVWADWEWVAQMLSTLPSAQRTVIELTIAELKAGEIADLLGKTPDAIRQNLAHARKRLRANLGKDYQIGPATCPAPLPQKKDTP
jgi:RNA polymerase sigma factor (sigma-70 family)